MAAFERVVERFGLERFGGSSFLVADLERDKQLSRQTLCHTSCHAVSTTQSLSHSVVETALERDKLNYYSGSGFLTELLFGIRVSN